MLNQLFENGFCKTILKFPKKLIQNLEYFFVICALGKTMAHVCLQIKYTSPSSKKRGKVYIEY